VAEAVDVGAAPTDQLVGPETNTTTRAGWRQPPRWLWPLSIVLQVLSATLLTSYTYFFVDDFIFMQQARNQALSLTYLRGSLFEHFSPITRLLDKVVVHFAPGDFAFAHGVQLALYAGALAAFALLAWTILGNSWSAFALTVAFGQSLFLMRLLNWFTATANILPSTIFLLLGIVGYLRWRPALSRWWLGLSLGAFVGSLLDYETALLFPAYLLLISLLVLEDELNPRAWIAALWRERWAWFGYGAIEVVALFNYFHYYYFKSLRPSLDQLVHYLKFALVDAFVPSLVGIKDPQAALSNHAIVILAAWLVVGGAVALTLYMRPRAWRCLAAFVVVFAITMVPVGLNRIRQFGIGIGHELYYEQSLQCMFLVLAALAVASRPLRGPPLWLARVISSARAAPQALIVGGVVAIAGYGALYITSVHAMADQSPEPHRARAYVDTFRASVSKARQRTGQYPVLVDHTVPADIIPPIFVPYNHYDEFFPQIQSHLRFDLAGGPTYVVDAAGRLVPVSFATISTGLLTNATASALDGSGIVRASQAGRPSACAPQGRATSRVHIPLSSPQTLHQPSSGLPYALLVRARMPVGAPVTVVLTGARGSLPDTGFPQAWAAGAAARFVPLTLSTQVAQVGLDLPAGACVTDLSLGGFQ
jgi:hypothetical protein